MSNEVKEEKGMIKELKRYTPKGLPLYENEKGERLCCLEGCYSKSYSHPLCPKHYKDDNDYTEYLESIRKPLNTYKLINNEYKLINNEYYEVTVPNSNDIFLIDKEDINFAKKYNWRASHPNEKYTYLIAKINYKHIKYHIEIMKDKIKEYRKNINYNKRIIIDHINGNTKDNRKENLRIRTQSENNMNKEIQKNNTTNIVGVSWNKKDKMWNAYISVKGKRITLGSFYYLRNAVKARIEAENKYFGEHAFKERENNKYKDFIKMILMLPEKPEPYIISTKKSSKYPTGVSYLSKINKYRANIEKNGIKEQKNFNTLEEAIQWRKKKEKEYFGEYILYSKDKKEKQI
ncbi:HNH endonuclease [Bacillus smithii]|uniref:HNH endonuclease n=1 Tax=Bacillus smithii TaxID=1479 RepID=UPI002E2335CB|nr:AP2 domain-containing protein [Bacillus smithii]MED4928284.1 AP2 domain-containing protein [Bacillus smithii]